MTGKLPTGSGGNDFSMPNTVILSVTGFVKSTYANWWPIPSVYSSQTNYDIGLNLNNTKSQFSLSCGSYYSTNSDYVITVLYTKTTD